MTESRDHLVESLKKIIGLKSRKPYLPFWGEVFNIIHQFKKLAKDDMPLYEIDPAGQLVYDHEKKRFLIRLPEMDIALKDYELVDSILKGLFLPKK